MSPELHSARQRDVITFDRVSRRAPVHLIVVSFNSARHLQDCLNPSVVERVDTLTVFDNASTDDSVEVARRCAPAACIMQGGENIGFAAAVNRATHGSLDDGYIFLLNPDCVIQGELIDCLETAMSEIGAAIGAPSMVLPSGQRGSAGGAKPTIVKEVATAYGVTRYVPRWARRMAIRSTQALGLDMASLSTLSNRYSSESLEVDWVSGFCMMIRADVWAELSGFNERFFMYFEDVDLCLRAKALGHRIVLAGNCQALHVEAGSSSSTRAKGLLYRSSARHFFNAHGQAIERHLARFIFGGKAKYR